MYVRCNDNVKTSDVPLNLGMFGQVTLCYKKDDAPMFRESIAGMEKIDLTAILGPDYSEATVRLCLYSYLSPGESSCGWCVPGGVSD